VELLLDGREETVQVDVQEAEAVGMDDGRHERLCSYYIRFLFAFNDVVSDAKWVAKIERIPVFASDLVKSLKFITLV